MNDTLFALITVDKTILPEGSYYVIDSFPFPCFIGDENCIPVRYATYEQAAAEAVQCQDGHVIKL